MRWTLDPKNDAVFKMLFAHPAHKGCLIQLLTAVLHPQTPIVAVRVDNPEIPRVLVDDRGIFLDVHVVLQDGSHVDVEMQQARHAHLAERILYYWARIYGTSLETKREYAALRPCASIIFMGENLLPGSRFHSTFQVLETSDHYALSKHLQIHILELPKLGQAAGDDEAVEWCSFLSAETDEELKDLAMTHPNLSDAIAALETLSSDRQSREVARQRDLDRATLLIMRQGEREEGREEERRETVRSLAAVLSLPLDENGERKLAEMDGAKLQRLVVHLREERAWPEGFGC
jgi:predicted transposase/invertase (TIGR01784 family)